MNPHYLFAAVMLASLAFTATAMISTGDTSELYEVAKVVGLTGAGIGAVMFATRRYWRNARRLAES